MKLDTWGEVGEGMKGYTVEASVTRTKDSE